jgi:hypothetical protein
MLRCIWLCCERDNHYRCYKSVLPSTA